MQQVECRIRRGDDLSEAERFIENVCTRRGLQLSRKGSLSTYPGSIHWHYKRTGQTGTLEITLLAEERRIWLQVQAGRRATWIDRELPAIHREIEKRCRLAGKRLSRPKVNDELADENNGETSEQKFRR
jgi:hypothetical protein